MSKFKDDKLKNEKFEPIEGSNFRLLNIPFGLLMMLIGHGVTYLYFKTNNTQLGFGDSRSVNPVAEVLEKEAQSSSSQEVRIVKVDLKKGKKIYKRSCSACHQADGMGVSGAFPPLGGSEWVNGSKERLASIMILGLNGKIHVNGEDFEGSMPAFKNDRKFKKKTENFSHVLSFIRNSFGNKTDAIEMGTIEKALKRWANREEPLNGQEELEQIKWDE